MLMDSVDTRELDQSFDEGDAMPFFESLQDFYTWLVPIPIILAHILCLASNFINYGARLGHYFYLYNRWVKMSASKLIHHFSSPPSDFLFQISLPPNNITLIFLISYWYWCSCSCHFRHRASYSHIRSILVGTLTSLQGTDGGLI